VASRAPDRSAQFITQCQTESPLEAIPAPFSTYEEMLASRNVDAVYLPVPTGARKEWVLRAAAARKHVLCEKPCAVNVADLREMIEACRRSNVQFMDGVMFMHSKRLARLRQALDAPETIGPITRITSSFSYRPPPDFLSSNIRGDVRLEPHGCVGDLGWYCIRLALWAMNWQMPDVVTGRILSQASGKQGEPGVITDFSGELIFPEGVSASFYCSFLAENQQWANLSGTRGYAHMDDFVLPVVGDQVSFDLQKFDFKIQGCDFRMESRRERVTVAEHSHGHADAQETNMFRNFAAQVLSGKLNEQWPEQALKTQTVMSDCLDAARAQA
jgi:predicted dehydrogenase